ncbi:ribonuclease inhibitor-like [Styela clava]
MSIQLSIECGIVCSKYNVCVLRLRDVELRTIHLLNFLKHVKNGKLRELDVSSNVNLGVEGVGVLGAIVSHCEVQKVGMQECNLTAEGIMAFKDKVGNAKIKKIDVSYNGNLGIVGVGVLGSTVLQCEVKKIAMLNCNLTAEALEAFRKNVGNSKIELLNIRFNKVGELGDEGLSTISEILHHCQLTKLWMEGCELNCDKLQKFKELIAGTGVEFLY